MKLTVESTKVEIEADNLESMKEMFSMGRVLVGDIKQKDAPNGIGFHEIAKQEINDES